MCIRFEIEVVFKGFTKLESRSRLRICIGRFPVHARNVALVLNPSTSHISPQCHLVFDDQFTIISSLREKSVPPNWKSLVATSE